MVMGLASDIKIKLGSEKDCVQTVTVEFSANRVKDVIEKAFESVRQKAKLPGFRPGKTPMELVKQNFKGNAYEKAQDILLREGVSEAIEQKKLNPVQPPVIQSMNFDPDKPFSFEFKVEVAPDVKISGYKGLKLTQTANPVKPEDIQKTLDEIAQGNAKLVESKDTEVSKKHHVVMDYEGFMNDAPISGAKQENFLMDLTSPQMIKGLDEGILGAKVDEERDVKVTFPEDSPAKELAGKEATFKIKIRAIKEKDVPPINDDLAKDLGLESLDQMKERIKEKISHEREQQTRRELQHQISEKLLEANKFPVPASLVTKQAEYIAARQKDMLGRQGLSEEDMKQVLENGKANHRAQGENEIRLQYILLAISQQENLAPTEEKINERISQMAATSGAPDPKSVEKVIREKYLHTVKSDLQDDNVYEWVIKNAKIKEVKK